MRSKQKKAPAGRQGAISDEDTLEECPVALIQSIRLARAALTHEEFWEWIDGLRHPIAPARTGLEDSMELYRDYLAGEMAQ